MVLGRLMVWCSVLGGSVDADQGYHRLRLPWPRQQTSSTVLTPPAMFSPPAPMMRQYCERDESGTGPVLDADEGEEVFLLGKAVFFQTLGLGRHVCTASSVACCTSPTLHRCRWIAMPL